jgi:adenylosuccinate lyase
VLAAELAAHPEVLAEALQTILRREGFPEPYEALKALTRGEELTLDDLAAFIDGLAVSDAVKAELRALSPERYVGLAARLARTRDDQAPGGW